MKIVFYQEHLCERGTTVALVDYAKYNISILGNESVIMYKKNHPLTHKKYEEFIVKNFNTVTYSNQDEIDPILSNLKADYFYIICQGDQNEFNSKVAKNLIHAVFNVSKPHSHRFAAISDSLSRGKVPVVPHMISLKKGSELQGLEFRKKLNVPENSILIGRHGGLETFNLKIAHDAVKICADKGVYFVFLNTYKFVDHPKVFFLEAITDIQEKTNFIMACDAMIHARFLGETFGLAIGEFSVCNKPIITYKHARSEWGEDHHLKTLGEYGFYYENVNELVNIIMNIKYKIARNCYEKYSPEKVMEMFKSVFLN